MFPNTSQQFDAPSLIIGKGSTNLPRT